MKSWKNLIKQVKRFNKKRAEAIKRAKAEKQSNVRFYETDLTLKQFYDRYS